MATDWLARILASEAQQSVDDLAQKVGHAFQFKGTVDTVEDLPSTGNLIGDMYTVKANGHEYAWTIDNEHPDGYWLDMGDIFDLSGYLMKDDLAQTTGSATDNTMSQKAITDAIDAVLPDVTIDDKGKVLMVNDSGQWNKSELPLATKIKYGLIKLGDGLAIDEEDGTTIVDVTTMRCDVVDGTNI